MSVEIRRAGPEDAELFERVADDVFDYAVEPATLADYLATPGHHLVVAIAGGEVVGQAAAVLHRHPDERPVELYIDELAVAPAFRRRGIARLMLDSCSRSAASSGARRPGSEPSTTTSQPRASMPRAKRRRNRS